MKQHCYLELADNFFGKLKPEIIKRINKYLRNPLVCGWDDIHSIIISSEGRTKTIWQAVIEIDPFFTRRGRTEDLEGNIIADWVEIPSPETVIKAINHVVLSKQLSHQQN